MALTQKSNLRWYLPAASILLAFGGLMAFFLIHSSTNGQPEGVPTVPTPNALTLGAPNPLNPDVPGSRPDSMFEEEVISLIASGNSKSEVKKSQNPNTRKPEGRMRPLDSFVESDSDTAENLDSLFVFPERIPGIDEKMLAILSSLVSQSHPIPESKTVTGKILDYKEKITNLLTSIFSQEITSSDKQDMLNTLSVIVFEHGTDPDIREKITIILYYLNKPTADQKLKGEMATVMARILSQDVDEAITWKMLNILQKIVSQEKDLDFKSKLLTVFSAIIREENSIGLQLKTANVLSTIIHQHGIDETRSIMVRLLSTIVPSVQKAESRAKSDDRDQEDFNQHLKIIELFQNVTGSKTPEADRIVLSGMLNATSVAVDKEKEKVVASPSIRFESTVEPLAQSRMTESMESVLSGVVSEKHRFGKASTENTEPGADLENSLQMVQILSKISADKNETPVAKFDENSEMIRLFSRIVNDEELVEIFDNVKAKMAKVLSTFIEDRKAPKADTDFEAKLYQVFTNIVEDDMVPEADSDFTAKMDDVLSTVVNKNKEPDSDLVEMTKIFSNIIDERKPPETLGR